MSYQYIRIEWNTAHLSILVSFHLVNYTLSFAQMKVGKKDVCATGFCSSLTFSKQKNVYATYVFLRQLLSITLYHFHFKRTYMQHTSFYDFFSKMRYRFQFKRTYMQLTSFFMLVESRMNLIFFFKRQYIRF